MANEDLLKIILMPRSMGLCSPPVRYIRWHGRCVDYGQNGAELKKNIRGTLGGKPKRCQYHGIILLLRGRKDTIGKRYRRQDIGTPYCITIDHPDHSGHYRYHPGAHDSINRNNIPAARIIILEYVSGLLVSFCAFSLWDCDTEETDHYLSFCKSTQTGINSGYSSLT